MVNQQPDRTQTQDLYSNSAPAQQQSPLESSPAPQSHLNITPAQHKPSDDWHFPRTGLGVDVHAFAPSDQPRAMHLACLEWPGENGLIGHSDADVAAHAACDALFAATGLGDLGSNFGTSRPEWAGASGEALLRETVRMVTAAGWQIANISIQIIGVRPKISPRRAEAEQTMSEIVGAPVSVSATTTDGLGFTGRGEGLAAMASALVFPAPQPVS